MTATLRISHTTFGPPAGHSCSSLVSEEIPLCWGPRNDFQSCVTAPAGNGLGLPCNCTSELGFAAGAAVAASF